MSEWGIWAEGDGLQTFHVHRFSDDMCAGTFTQWGCDDEMVLSKRITVSAAALITIFEETSRG